MKIDGIGAFSQLLQLMKATVLAESSYFIYFHWVLSAPVMSTDVSQVDVFLFLLFKIFFIILPFQVFLLYKYYFSMTRIINASVWFFYSLFNLWCHSHILYCLYICELSLLEFIKELLEKTVSNAVHDVFVLQIILKIYAPMPHSSYPSPLTVKALTVAMYIVDHIIQLEGHLCTMILSHLEQKVINFGM